MHIFSSVILLALGQVVSPQVVSPDQLALSHSLTVSTTLPFPTGALASGDGDDFVVSSWSLNKNRIQNTPENLAFVSNPFPNDSSPISSSPNTTNAVLQITYPAGSFGDNDGGVQFYSLFNGSISPQSMMVSYEVAFDKGFQFVQGGKLPGLRGGPVTNGCEGGDRPNGTDCWSARMMWRKDGQGEVYAYIPDSDDLCSQSDIICNSDFGTSIGRGSFSFIPGTWNRITMLVQLNSRGDLANGEIWLYYNDVMAIHQTNLQLRSSTNVLAGGLFFSTFFGGSDESWETPTDQHSYFRNFQLWASDSPSNSTGAKVSSAASIRRIGRWVETTCLAAAILGCVVGIL